MVTEVILAAIALTETADDDMMTIIDQIEDVLIEDHDLDHAVEDVEDEDQATVDQKVELLRKKTRMVTL